MAHVTFAARSHHAGFAASLAAALRGWIAERSRRRALERVAELPEDILKDVGLLRNPEIAQRRRASTDASSIESARY